MRKPHLQKRRDPNSHSALDEPDVLVPDATVLDEFSVSAMTIHRWDHDPEMSRLGWPPAIKIRRRKFRSRKTLEAFKATLVRIAVEARGHE